MEYCLTKNYYGQGDSAKVEVEVSFVLDYPGWCKLEQSEIWHRLEEAVEALQKGQE